MGSEARNAAVPADKVPADNDRDRLDRISRIILGAADIASLLPQVARAVLEIFESDRAWLLYPCDPEAPTWSIPIEVTRPEFPGAFSEQAEIATDAFAAQSFRAALASDAPLTHIFDEPIQTADFQERYRIRSQMVAAMRPRVGKPWLLGIHQCSHRREWSEAERLLFREIADRITDSLSTLLLLRQLEADIAERKRVEEELRASRAMFQLVLDTIPQGVFWKDRNSVYLGVNRIAGRASGFPDPAGIVGKTDYDLPGLTREQADFFIKNDREAMAANAPQMHLIEPMRQSDGTTLWLDTNKVPLHDARGEVIGVLGTWEDITERKRLEDQLRHAQKMEAVGNLTGGMAHDFNNLLGIIIGNLDLLRTKKHGDPDVEELAGSALNAALHGAELTRSLLAFARRQPLQPKRVDVNALVSRTVALLRRTLGENVEIGLELGSEIWPVIADPAQLEASLANLATNARDAMANGGRLTFATGNRQLDEDYAAWHTDLVAGDYVMIEASDTGAGMTPDVMSRIFDPFFTTKEPGKGTGLGLAMVFGFVKQSKGHVTVYSEVGSGTSFRLYLPRVPQSGSGAEAPAMALIEPGTGETVLAVEDNPALRQVVVRQLKENGYRVLEADSAAAALGLLEREQPHLLFTDVMMPGGMNGHELARTALARWPALKVLLTSGFPEATLSKGGEPALFRLLIKPYRREELARAVREVLRG